MDRIASPIGIVMNGVTGRMGYRQHLVRSLLAIREQGGLDLGRRHRARGPSRSWSAAASTKLRDDRRAARPRPTGPPTSTRRSPTPTVEIYFDAQVTQRREKAIRQAIAAGKHIYTEKPTADDLDGAARAGPRSPTPPGVKHGVVQDKLFLPGPAQAQAPRSTAASSAGSCRCAASSATGSSRATGRPRSARRWNYRAEDGGGIVVDMFPHWEYVLRRALRPGARPSTAHAATHIPQRWDEHGKPYDATADDAAYGIFELEGGVIAQINSSWAVRVNRDELVEFQVDGTEGSAVAGPAQLPRPAPRRHPEAGLEPRPAGHRAPSATSGRRCPDNDEFDNGFKAQWELFLRHVVADAPVPRGTSLAGARGVQLAELGLHSLGEGRRLDVPELAL